MDAPNRKYKKNLAASSKAGGTNNLVYKYGVLVTPGQTTFSQDLLAHGREKTQDKEYKSKSTIDPRYKVAKEDYAYPGQDASVDISLDNHLITPEPKVRDCGNFLIWGLIGAGVSLASIVLLIIILYVFGELTGNTPIQKGYFG